VTSPAQVLLFDRINAALPQTQCTRCGYPDCAAYALAIAAGDAAINQCPPGGAEGVQRLASITGQPVQPLNPSNGAEGPRTVAVIDEAWCIGCTLCIAACPTDTIFGSNKTMHTVIEPYCTGCELCIPVCPVDCITLENVTGAQTGWHAWSQDLADLARGRYALHRTRASPQNIAEGDPPEEPALKQAHEQEVRRALDLPAPPLPTEPLASEKKRNTIEAALARARERRVTRPASNPPHKPDADKQR
jgi:Na+-translocating ferredoxin:NAD+ oxidoreductase subunit B